MPASRRLLALLALLGPIAGALRAQELPRDAEKLYALLCANCHGAKLEGGQSGSLIDPIWKHGDGGEAHLTRLIVEGAPDAGMPGFGPLLDAPRVDALVNFIRARAETGAVAAAAAEPRAEESSSGSTATDADTAFKLETVVEGLEVPWSFTFLPGSRDVLVAERDGRLRVVRAGRLLPDAIRDTPRVMAEGQGGLMIVQAHPDYATPGRDWIYLAFSDPSGRDRDSMTAVVRGRIRDGRWTEEQQIYRAPREFYRGSVFHFGTRLVFHDGYLFFAIGDRGAPPHAQDLGRPNGKIHRLHDDGRVPVDNPFVDHPEALPSIWSYGHRNPQGLAMRYGEGDSTPQLWSTEHGPRGGDELNLVRRGANYGWPLVTFGINYNGTKVSDETTRPGLESPVVHWTPSVATCGLIAYSGEVFPAWKGDLFAGALAGQELRRIVIKGEQVVSQKVIVSNQGRVRSVQQGPDGLIYLAFEQPGRIVRLVPAD
jgi:glucose/arabinose dehydrogenase